MNLVLTQLLAGGQHIPPCCEVMQLDTNLGKAVRRVGENIIIENHEGMSHFSASCAQSLHKIQLTAAISCQILNQ